MQAAYRLHAGLAIGPWVPAMHNSVWPSHLPCFEAHRCIQSPWQRWSLVLRGLTQHGVPTSTGHTPALSILVKCSLPRFLWTPDVGAVMSASGSWGPGGYWAVRVLAGLSAQSLTESTPGKTTAFGLTPFTKVRL